jgi:mono/diheme cytochrome c family protein
VRNPRALALPVAAGVTVAIATFAIVMAVDGGGDEREGAGQAQAATTPDTVRGHARGRALFFEMGCGSCHELAATGSTGTIGPNLDLRLPAHGRASLTATILNPPGSGGGSFSVMPDNFRERMSSEEVDALVGYLLAARTDRER